MDKIEKLGQIVEVEFLREVERNRDKINEIIDILNSRLFEPTITVPSPDQKQPEVKEPHHHSGKDGCCIRCGISVGEVQSVFCKDTEKQPEGLTDKQVVDFVKHTYQNRELNQIAKETEKQEKWRGRWWKLKDSQDSRRIALLNNCMEDKLGSLQEYMRYQGEEKAEEVDFISQLLSERAFTKEELEWIRDVLFLGKYSDYSDEEMANTEYKSGIGMDVLKKIVKLLEEKE